MSANNDWDNWMNKFIEMVVQMLEKEDAKGHWRPIVIPSQLPENDLLKTRTVARLTNGVQMFVDTVKKPQKGNLKPNSIGRLYKASLPNCGLQLGISYL